MYVAKLNITKNFAIFFGVVKPPTWRDVSAGRSDLDWPRAIRPDRPAWPGPRADGRTRVASSEHVRTHAAMPWPREAAGPSGTSTSSSQSPHADGDARRSRKRPRTESSGARQVTLHYRRRSSAAAARRRA